MQLRPLLEAEGEASSASTLPPQVQALVASGRRVFLSINRFERKKVRSRFCCGERHSAAEPDMQRLACRPPLHTMPCNTARMCRLACSSKPQLGGGRAPSLLPGPKADAPGWVQNVALAIRALEVALQKPAGSSSPSRWPLLQRLTSQRTARSPTPGCCLVVAGGYDQRLPENREVLAELQALAQRLGVQEHVRNL